jgi:hypothetical protein
MGVLIQSKNISFVGCRTWRPFENGPMLAVELFDWENHHVLASMGTMNFHEGVVENWGPKPYFVMEPLFTRIASMVWDNSEVLPW